MTTIRLRFTTFLQGQGFGTVPGANGALLPGLYAIDVLWEVVNPQAAQILIPRDVRKYRAQTGIGTPGLDNGLKNGPQDMTAATSHNVPNRISTFAV
jgi:hypothetical protein